MRSAWGFLRAALEFSLDAAPEYADPDGVRRYLHGLPGVSSVHDLHVWPLSKTDTTLTAHLVISGGVTEPNGPLAGVCRELRDRFGVEHATLQLETGSCV